MPVYNEKALDYVETNAILKVQVSEQHVRPQY